MVTSIDRPRGPTTAFAVRWMSGGESFGSTGSPYRVASTAGTSDESGERFARSTACGTIPGS